MAQLKIKNGIIKTKISGIYTAFQFRTQVCQIFPFKIPFRLNCVQLATRRAISSPGDQYPPGSQKSYLISW